MTYFSNIPMVTYDFTINTDRKDAIYTLSDVTTRVGKFTDLITEDILLDEYSIEEGETPESISLKLYETMDYYWTILYVNGIMDMADDWPKSEEVLYEYVNATYPGIAKSDVIIPFRGYSQNFMENDKLVSYIMIDSAFYSLGLDAELDEITNSITVLDWIYAPHLSEDLEFQIIDTELDVYGRLKKLKLSALIDNPDYIISAGSTPISGYYFGIQKTNTMNAIKYYRSALYNNINTKQRIEELSYTTEAGTKISMPSGDEAVPITNYDYEIEVNEAKRKINVISPTYIDSFVTSFFRQIT
jgi:hypothetical protein